MAISIIAAIGSAIAGEAIKTGLIPTVSAQEAFELRALSGGYTIGRTTEEGVRGIVGLPGGGYRAGLLDELFSNPAGRASATFPMIGVAPRNEFRPLPPIVGTTEFSAPIGPPSMTPRAIVQRTPPNLQTPADGIPGGSFNYNSLLSALFKWDRIAAVEVANPGNGNTILELVLPTAGLWAVEAEISSEALMSYSLDVTDNGVQQIFARYLSGPSMGTNVHQNVFLITRAADVSGSGMVSGVELVSRNVTVAGYWANLRAKQLASV